MKWPQSLRMNHHDEEDLIGMECRNVAGSLTRSPTSSLPRLAHRSDRSGSADRRLLLERIIATCRSHTTVLSCPIVLQNPCMRICNTKSAWVLGALGISALWAGTANGALGGRAASVLADGAAMGVGVQSEIRPQYDVLTISTTAGISVREYLNRDGIVFAVNWSGPVPADLQQLLGVHYATYAAAAAAVAHPGFNVRSSSNHPDSSWNWEVTCELIMAAPMLPR